MDDLPRTNQARLGIVAGAVLTALTIGFGPINVLGLLVHAQRHETFSFNAVETVNIATDGMVTVRSGAAGTISVDRRVERGLRDANYTTSIDAGALSLRGSCPSQVNQWCQVDYTVAAPTGTRVRVRSAGGNTEQFTVAPGTVRSIDTSSAAEGGP
jgi:hypothetical protein